jgi:hypothetical protein
VDPRKEEILAVERRRCEALDAGDLATLRELTSREYLHVHGDGASETFEEYFADLERVTYRRTERGDLRVRFFGPVAVVTGPHVTTIRRGDGPFLRIVGVWAQVWHDDDGSWKNVLQQNTLTEPVVEVEGP